MDNGKVVWGPDIDHGFVIGSIIDINQKTITVKPRNPSGKVWLKIFVIKLKKVITYKN